MLEGNASGGPHPLQESYASKFTDVYAHRTIEGGIGHNLPKEASGAFAQHVTDGDRTCADDGPNFPAAT
jgi:hypothetical protein